MAAKKKVICEKVMAQSAQQMQYYRDKWTNLCLVSPGSWHLNTKILANWDWDYQVISKLIFSVFNWDFGKTKPAQPSAYPPPPPTPTPTPPTHTHTDQSIIKFSFGTSTKKKIMKG